MKNLKNKILIIFVSILVLTGGLCAFADKMKTSSTENMKSVELNLAENTKTSPNTVPQPKVNEGDYICVKPLQIVANPNAYLDKKVKFTATFDKFSVLGLDYKPAFRDSQKYITFLIKRDDVTDHTIPLSEMKIFIQRTEAEKFIELDSGDIIEVYGKVFSNALTDAWVDVEKLVVVKKVNKDKEKKA